MNKGIWGSMRLFMTEVVQVDDTLRVYLISVEILL